LNEGSSRAGWDLPALYLRISPLQNQFSTMVEERKGIGTGLVLGIVFGIIFDNIALGIVFGLVFGAAFDKKQKSKHSEEE